MRSGTLHRLYVTILALGIVMGVAGLAAPAAGQDAAAPARSLAANVLVPQSRARPAAASAVIVTAVDAEVRVIEQVAITTLTISLHNPHSAPQEAELIVPVPQGAAVRGFAYQGAAAEPTATLLPHDEARSIYDQIVSRSRDPALLEFVGYNAIRSSVFPVDARGTQRVRLTYEHLLLADGSRVDYVLPRTESIDYAVPWRVRMHLRSKQPIATVYSPTHELTTLRQDAHQVVLELSEEGRTTPGSLQLSYLRGGEGVAASLLAYPDPAVDGGYFLLLAGLPAEPADRTPAIKRDVTLVIDRSGSMRGEKLAQVREAALQVLSGLEDGETFNLILYNEAVEVFSERPVLKSAATLAAAERYLGRMTPRGGTNIHDALLEALRLPPVPDTLPIVLFLTDGLPTVGQTTEAGIREAVEKANRHDRRVFTFGVGADVNTPLLEKVARQSRATATFVLPQEDVEVKVARVFRQLKGPVLTDLALRVVEQGEGPDATPSLPRISERVPDRLPDLFEGDQLVVLGQYRGEEPLTLELGGTRGSERRTYRFSFDLDRATTGNAFVPRLWATRKIAVLVEAIRSLGAERPGQTVTAGDDPRLDELIQEVVRLSTQFGVLTEYTAFLAREGTDLSAPEVLLGEARNNFINRALQTRSGLASVNQEMNNQAQYAQKQLNARNTYWDDKMQRVQITSVQQVSDGAFYKRGERWIDSRLLDEQAQPRRVIAVGSEAFDRLVDHLARQGRQSVVALQGEILLEIDGEAVLLRSEPRD